MAIITEAGWDARTRPQSMAAKEEVRSDTDLIAAAWADRQAFGLLYERYRERIYWYLRRRAGDADDAADLMQMVFLKALDNLHRYDPSKGPFAGWLFAIARNTAFTHRTGRRLSITPHGHRALVAASDYGRAVVHLGTGAGKFDSGHDIPLIGYGNPGTATRVTLAIADLNCDHRPDVVIADELDNAVMVLRNTTGQGQGTGCK